MDNRLFNLKGKTAYVLGGSGLIGTEIIRLLSQYNSKVINLDIKNNLKNKNYATFEKFDCSNLNLIELKLNKIFKRLNFPNIFINCSFPKTQDWSKNSFKKIKYYSFKKNLEMHLNSSAWITKFVAQQMCRKKIKGSIIQTGSIYGLVGQDLNIYEKTKMTENMSYSIMKGGITNFTRLAASYFGKYGIRVNTVCPGGVEDGKQEIKFLKNYKKRVPLKRLAKPREIACAYLFLSSEASSYITGSSFIVDGGWTAI